MKAEWQAVVRTLFIAALVFEASLSLSGCAAPNQGGMGFKEIDEAYILRRQLQAHGEFHRQNVATEYARYYDELKERQSRG